MLITSAGGVGVLCCVASSRCSVELIEDDVGGVDVDMLSSSSMVEDVGGLGETNSSRGATPMCWRCRVGGWHLAVGV